jgi:hypothetical protein
LLAKEETQGVTELVDFPILLPEGELRQAIANAWGSAYLGPQGEVLVLGDHHSLCSPVQIEPSDGMLLVVVEGELVDVPEVMGALGEDQAAKIHSICRIEEKQGKG